MKDPFSNLLSTKSYKQSKSKGETIYNGPCPLPSCQSQGNDRFVIYPISEARPSGSFYCRQCKSHGNGIKFHAIMNGMTEEEAKKDLGIESKNYQRKFIPSKEGQELMGRYFASFIKKPENDTAKWKEQAAEFLKRAKSVMRPPFRYIAYLTGRGFAQESIRSFRFGWNVQDIRADSAAWGIQQDKEYLLLPSGLVIPSFDADGTIARLTIRLSSSQKMGHKYHVIPGSQDVATIVRPWQGGRPAVLVESELDAYLIAQEAGDIVDAIATGGATKPLDEEAEKRLGEASLILVAMDNDQAGHEAASSYKAKHPSSHILRMPRCRKDPTDAKVAGADLRRWLLNAIASPAEQTPIRLFTEKAVRQILTAIPKGERVCLDLSSSVWNMLSSQGWYALELPSEEMGLLDMGECKADFVVWDSYRQRKKLEALGITQPVESISIMKSFAPPSLTLLPNSEDALGLSEMYDACQPLLADPHDKAFYRDLCAAQPFLGNMPPFRVDRPAFTEILLGWKNDPAKQGMITTWESVLAKYPEELPTFLVPNGAATSRFSCSEPPMQALPKELRAALLPTEGKVLVDADFHSIQPRIIAELSGDPEVRDIFAQGRDWYKAWASAFFQKPEEEIDALERAMFKKPSLAWLYGRNEAELVEDLVNEGIARETALEGFARFNEKFSRLVAWKAQCSKQAEKEGKVFSVTGRAVRIPQDKAYAAICYIAQASETDIMLKAVLPLGKALQEKLPTAKIKFCLHDELMLECEAQDAEQAGEMLARHLQEAFACLLPGASVVGLLDIN